MNATDSPHTRFGLAIAKKFSFTAFNYRLKLAHDGTNARQTSAS
jgi:hypothetical protein